MTTTPFVLPAAGPRDAEVWLTLVALCRADRGAIDPDTGEVWCGDTAERVRWRLDPDKLDPLIALGWVDDSRAADEIVVTEKGRYWARRFIRLNGGDR